MTSRERWTLLLLGALYAAVVVPIGIHRGQDFAAHVRLSEQLIHHQPVYDVKPLFGSWWPPFSLLVLAPFTFVAALSLPLAKACWALLGVICIGWSIVRARVEAGRWGPVVLAVAAVGVPLQRNFETLNINPELLALVMAATLDLQRGRDSRAGVWVGLAAALKIFPGLLLLYLLYRRRWRAAAVGASVAVGATLAALLPLGHADGVAALRQWIELSRAAAWTPNPGNVASIVAVFGGSHMTAIVVNLACLLVVVWVLGHPRTEANVWRDVSAWTLLAVLLSPIAWIHYYLLAFPAWIAVLTRRQPVGDRRVWRAALWVAGVLTAGALTHGPPVWRSSLYAVAIYAWGGVLLLFLLLLPPPAEPQPQRA